MARCNGGGDMGIASSHSPNDADFIISRDEKAFRKAKIRQVTAGEYLDTVCA